jgi:hypothetical protein
MTTNSVRGWVGMIIVISHFLILVIVLTSPWYAKLDSQKALSLATVIAPLFAGFSTAIIKYFVRHAEWQKDESKKASLPHIVISFFVPVLFAGLVIFFFLGFALNYLNLDFETARLVIASLEGFFGVYVGFILEGMFNYSPPPNKPAPDSTDPTEQLADSRPGKNRPDH